MGTDAGNHLPLRKKPVRLSTVSLYWAPTFDSTYIHNYSKCMNSNLIIAGSSLIVRNTGQQFIFDEEKI